MTLSTPPLANEHVSVEPLSVDHAAALFDAARDDPETFRYFSRVPPTWDEAGMRWYVEKLIATEKTVPFAVFDRASGRAVGGTSYCDIREANRGLEIGWTWYAPDVRGTKINPATKLALLTHAFEGGVFGGEDYSGGAIRVQLKTDERNARSRRGIEKLGAVFEGILRDHVIMPDGHLRQTAMYAITRAEWPGVRRKLEERLA